MSSATQPQIDGVCTASGMAAGMKTLILICVFALNSACSLAIRAELLNPLNKSGRTETSEPVQPKPLPTPPPAATPSPSPTPWDAQ